MSDPFVEKAEGLAKRLDTYILVSIPIHLWPLNILEKLIDKIEELEQKTKSLEDKVFDLQELNHK